MRLRAGFLLASTILAVVLSGPSYAQTSAQPLEKVLYLLPAPAARPAFGPWMVAKQRGYYAAEGLDIEFQTAKGGVDVAKQVGVGNALIGGALGDTPIIVRGNDVPIKAVAVLGGGGLTQLMVHEDSDIKGPADLRGKTVTVLAYQDTTFYALLGMLAHAGMTKNDVDIQAAGPSGIWQLFLARKAVAMASAPDYIGYVQENGGKVRVIPGDEFFPSMAQAILASDKTIKERPDFVRKLVRATLRGMTDIVADPAGTAIDFVKAAPENAGREKTVQSIFEFYTQYVYRGQPKPGFIDRQRLAKLQDFYVAQQIAQKAVPVEDLFTNQFIGE
ncbi:MAG: nitrate transporter substrate-binding protein [Hyphomicrobiales bacterium]|jgi:NitT/TauT family transport system substrate-binding protein|nr:nitrate transporter substrate-binding protein [Hyphomicrobiales bacterium]